VSYCGCKLYQLSPFSPNLYKNNTMAKNYDKSFIENFLLNRLSKEEQAAFLKKMDEDEGFRKEVALHENMLKVLLHKKNRSLKDMLEKEEKNLEKSGGGKPDGGLRRKLGIRALVATVVLMIALLVIIWFSRQNTPPPTAQALFVPQKNSYILVDREGTREQNVLNEAFRAYEDGEYEKASELFPKVVSPEEPQRYYDLLFYRANALMALDRSAEAIPMLELILQMEKTSYLSNTQWYLALAFLMNDQKEKARPLLEELAKNSFYKEKAERLLKK
jgi:hypothetical protein